MDPNETLAILSALVAEVEAGDVDARDTADDFHEHFKALDEWLSKQGFLPAAWAIAGERG
jgi:hypothetical protein